MVSVNFNPGSLLCQKERLVNYSILEHRHRFACWAASRAASVNGNRFKVKDGQWILEKSDLHQIMVDGSSLPESSKFDEIHAQWRNQIIYVAKEIGKEFTHGVAAKLINVYLKSIFICTDNLDDPKIKAIHPPIDSVLLDTLYKHDIGGKRKLWQTARQIRWSNFNSIQYQQVIDGIRSSLPSNAGLWEIEAFWRGYR
jgi:hypothetical protein